MAAQIVSLLDGDGRFDVIWITTPELEDEYGFEDTDVLIRAGRSAERLAVAGATPAVLYMLSELPGAPSRYYSPVHPIGIVLSEAGERELASAVAALAEGLSLGPPVVVSDKGSAAEKGVVDSPSLTERELEVLRLLSFGMANKEIAWELSISDNTVKFHLSSIFVKLGVDNRVSAVRAAIEAGLLEL